MLFIDKNNTLNDKQNDIRAQHFTYTAIIHLHL